MPEIVLFEPEIPPNTGNIMRLCANTGIQLHLIRPLGFDLDEKKLRRAGMDYRDFADVCVHQNMEAFLTHAGDRRLMACTTRGSMPYTSATYQDDDFLIFGPETRGLPQAFIDALPPEQRIRIPMKKDSRSLNLSNASAVILYEALRQQGFEGLC